jgi:hypothetical protein
MGPSAESSNAEIAHECREENLVGSQAMSGLSRSNSTNAAASRPVNAAGRSRPMPSVRRSPCDLEDARSDLAGGGTFRQLHVDGCVEGTGTNGNVVFQPVDRNSGPIRILCPFLEVARFQGLVSGQFHESQTLLRQEMDRSRPILAKRGSCLQIPNFKSGTHVVVGIFRGRARPSSVRYERTDPAPPCAGRRNRGRRAVL